MATLNKVFLIGNLTRDPELRYIPSGTAVTTFGLAVNRNWVTPQGEKKQDTCFVRVVVWGRVAELCGEYLYKGSPAFIEGRLQYRAWEEQGGAKRSTIEVRAERVQFLGRPKGGAGVQQEAQKPRQADKVQDINLEDDMGVPDSGGGPGGPDDLPF